jgi:hypothetical protein
LARPLRADDGIRTRDPHLGKVMLYQLSHVRVRLRRLPPATGKTLADSPPNPQLGNPCRTSAWRSLDRRLRVLGVTSRDVRTLRPGTAKEAEIPTVIEAIRPMARVRGPRAVGAGVYVLPTISRRGRGARPD